MSDQAFNQILSLLFTAPFLAAALFLVCGKRDAVAVAPRTAIAFVAGYAVQAVLGTLLLLPISYISPLAVVAAIVSHERIGFFRAVAATVLGFVSSAVVAFLLFAAVIGSQ